MGGETWKGLKFCVCTHVRVSRYTVTIMIGARCQNDIVDLGVVSAVSVASYSDQSSLLCVVWCVCNGDGGGDSVQESIPRKTCRRQLETGRARRARFRARKPSDPASDMRVV